MEFHRRFRVEAPLEAVAAFHRSAASLSAITPPVVPMSGVEAPEVLGAGDRMTFTLWMGPLPVRWEARIAEADDRGFVDVQEKGPFASWRHRHRFEPAGTGVTWVDDRIEARLARHPLWGPVGLSMWVGLPGLFLYRTWRTRQILEERPARRS